MRAAAAADVELAKKAAASAAAAVEACTAKVAAAVANCKGVKYARAQEAYNVWDD